MKIISTQIHGILDYITGLLLIGLPWLLHFTDLATPTWICILVGASILTMSIFTNYESGVIRTIAMKNHLRTDLFVGAFLSASPWLLGFYNELYLPFLAVGMFTIVVTILTSSESYEQ
jgi:hypothetical protein